MNNSDDSTVNYIFHNFDVNIKLATIQRLGKLISNRMGPIKDMLHTISDIYKILGLSWQLGSSSFILCFVYILPRSPIIVYEQFFYALNELYQHNLDAKIILFGDFNLSLFV